MGLGVSPDEKIFTPTDERGFFPYTLFQVSLQYPVFSDQMRVFQFTVHSEKLPTSPLPQSSIPFKQDLVLACINISDCVVKFG